MLALAARRWNLSPLVCVIIRVNVLLFFGLLGFQIQIKEGLFACIVLISPERRQVFTLLRSMHLINHEHVVADRPWISIAHVIIAFAGLLLIALIPLVIRVRGHLWIGKCADARLAWPAPPAGILLDTSKRVRCFLAKNNYSWFGLFYRRDTTRWHLACCWLGHLGVEGDPATSWFPSLSALVEEVVSFLLVNLAVVVPLLRRKTFLKSLYHFL